MKTLRTYKKILLGTNNGERIYLTPPSWDCGHYWGFGYLGNKNCHYHVSGLKDGCNLHTGFKKHFQDLLIRESHLWTFAELFETFYILKSTAEVLERGGSYLPTNPCADIIKNFKEFERINKIVLPAIFDEIYKIIDKNRNNKTLFSQLVKLNLKGDTAKVVSFMIKNDLTTDDLKDVVGLSPLDINVIHSKYWRTYHKTK